MSKDGEMTPPIMGEIELGAAAEATVQAYKELAADPMKRLPLALDTTCVHFLAYVIAEGTGSLIQVAVDTVGLLSQSPECRSPLANTFGVLEALQEMADDARYCEELRDQAASIFTCLQFSRYVGSSNAQTPSDSIDSCNKTPENSPQIAKRGPRRFEKAPTKKNTEASEQPVLKRSDGSFLGPLNSKAKSVTLYIKNMTSQAELKLVEEELIKVRGLVSVVFDLSHSRVTCRVKKDLSIDKLAAAVARTEKCHAQQVLPGTDGDEKIVNIAGQENDNATSPDDLPDYLPEEDSPVKDTTSAMAPSGSLREAATSILSAAANLLHKSFYW